MKAGKRMGWLALCLVVLLASIVVQVIAAILVMFPVSFMVGIQAGMQGVTDMETINQMSYDAVNGALPITLIVTHLLLLLTFGLWYRFGCGKPRLKEVPFKTLFAPKNLFVMVLVAAGMCFFVNFAMPVASLVIPESIMESYEALMESAGFGESLLPTIAAVLIAPFGEEFIYRGVTFYYAKKAVADLPNRRMAFWIANVIQALGFGIFHLNVVQGTYAFVMGLALGYLAHRFRSVLPSILGHMIINGLSSFAWEPVANALPENYGVYAGGAVICLTVMFVGMYLGGSAEKNTVAAEV